MPCRAVPSVGPTRRLVGTARAIWTTTMMTGGHHMSVRNSGGSGLQTKGRPEEEKNGGIVPSRRRAREHRSFRPAPKAAGGVVELVERRWTGTASFTEDHEATASRACLGGDAREATDAGGYGSNTR